jgi:hypothetical protein
MGLTASSTLQPGNRFSQERLFNLADLQAAMESLPDGPRRAVALDATALAVRSAVGPRFGERVQQTACVPAHPPLHPYFEGVGGRKIRRNALGGSIN